MAARDASVGTIDVPPGGTLEISVAVGEMAIPYSVAYGGRTLTKSLVETCEGTPLRPSWR